MRKTTFRNFHERQMLFSLLLKEKDLTFVGAVVRPWLWPVE